jgi:hypothetical protein
MTDLLPKLRRAFPRSDAAYYLGIGISKFDQYVSEGRISPPRMADTKPLWDIRDLDEAFENLPRKNEVNQWDKALSDGEDSREVRR